MPCFIDCFDAMQFGFSETQAPASAATVIGSLVRRSVMAGVLVLSAGFALFVSEVASLKPPGGALKADAIIVLTGGQDRLQPAFRLLEAKAGRKLLVSGVNTATRKADLASASGVDPALLDCCVELDHKALDTIGNAKESAIWLRDNGFSSVILVTSNYHMPRARHELRRLAGSATIIAYPLAASDLSGGRWLTEPDTLRVLVIEYAKLCLSFGRTLFSGSPAKAEPPRL
jgi:uncharacterized SAM-binding protein YcdF (DUF218 family)